MVMSGIIGSQSFQPSAAVNRGPDPNRLSACVGLEVVETQAKVARGRKLLAALHYLAS